MAVEVMVRKLYDSIVPVDAANAELFEDLKPNGQYKAVFTQPRNALFHRKAFALLKVAFDAWDMPMREHNGQPVAKNFEQFRNDVTILAGFYKVVFNYKGDFRLISKSWSYAGMDQTEFEALYSKLIDVILGNILNSHYTREDLDRLVENVLRFA